MLMKIQAMLSPKNPKSDNFCSSEIKYLPREKSSRRSFKSSNIVKNCKQERKNCKPLNKKKLNLTKSENKLPKLSIKGQSRFMKGRNKFKTNGSIRLLKATPQKADYNLHPNKGILQPVRLSVSKTMIWWNKGYNSRKPNFSSRWPNNRLEETSNKSHWKTSSIEGSTLWIKECIKKDSNRMKSAKEKIFTR